MNETDANRLVTRLNEVQIEAWKEKQADGKWMVSTSSETAMRALKHLDDARILRQAPVDDLPPPSIMASREERKQQSERLVAREIEESILSIQGVLEAHVHLNIVNIDLMFERRPKVPTSSASVVLVVDGKIDIVKEDIATLVAGATGIEQKSIAVMLAPGSAVATGTIESDTQTIPINRREKTIVLALGIILAVVGTTLLYIQNQRLRKGSATISS